MTAYASALFANAHERNLHSTVTLVEEALVELGHALPSCRQPDGAEHLHAWRFSHGSAQIDIALLVRADITHLRVASTVVRLDAPDTQAAALRYALETNAQLAGCAFALVGNALLVVTDRPILDLDRSEVRDLITRVATTADAHDDVLVERFGATLR